MKLPTVEVCDFWSITVGKKGAVVKLRHGVLIFVNIPAIPTGSPVASELLAKNVPQRMLDRSICA